MVMDMGAPVTCQSSGEMSLIIVGIEAYMGCIKKGPQFYPHWK